MRYVYAVWTDEVVHGFGRGKREHAPIMLASLARHCDCTALMQYHTDEPTKQTAIDACGDMPLILSQMYTHELDQLIQTKIVRLLCQPFEYGDEVFVMDVDVIVQADIFDVFKDSDFDVGITKRHYDYFSPINCGVWCFRYNERTQRFIELYVTQMLYGTWPPYLEFTRSYDETYPNDRYVFPADIKKRRMSDQDFLCAVYKNGMKVPFDCKVVDIGWQYNYCPPSDLLGADEACRQLTAALGDPTHKVLHFKGRPMKEAMIEIGATLK